MFDVATLGVKVDSSGVVRATGDLDRFAGSAGDAENAAKRMGTGATDAAKKAAAANDNAASAATKAASAYRRLNIAVAGVAATIAGAFVMGVRSAVSRLGEMDRVNAQVNKALENAGTMAGHSAESIRRWADELEKSTGRAASEVMAVSANLASFGFNEDVFFRAIKLADDMSAAWGGDLRQNLEGLSRALENPEKGLAMLSARGITFTAEGRKMATELAGVGRAAEAAAVLMDELEGQVKGVAEAGFNGLTRASANARRGMVEFFDEFVRLSGAGRAYELTLLAVAAAFEGMTGVMRAVVANLDQVAEAAATVGVAFSLVFGRAALTLLATSFGWFVGGVLAGLGAIKAAVLANPLGALATVLVVAVAAAYYFRDEIQKAIGVDVVSIAKTAANFVLNSFEAAYEDLKFIWSNFGDILGAAVIGGVNLAIRALNRLLTSAKVVLNDLIEGFNKIPGVNIDKFDVTLDPIRTMWNAPAHRLENANDAHRANIEGIMSRDVIGGIGNAFKASEQAAADFSGAVAAANQNLEQMGDGGAGGTAKKALDAVKGAADRAKDAIESAKQSLGQGFGSILEGLVNKTISWRDALMQAGRELLKYFNTMNMQATGSGLFGGGFLQGLLGGILGFQSGGYTGAGAPSTPAGIVHANEYVFSSPAVDRLGIGYLDALHNAAKGYQMGGYVRLHTPANVNMRGYQGGGYVPRAPQYGNAAPAELHVYVHAEEGKMFRPVVRAEAQGVAVQVTQAAAPGIVQGSVSATQQASRNRPGFFR